MAQSRFDVLAGRIGKVLAVLLLLVILIPLAFVGFRIARELLFPRIGTNMVANVNRETGEKEYLTLARFYRIAGTPFLAAGLSAERRLSDAYYSQYGSKIRNYLLYDVETKKSRWLLPTNSALLRNSHELLRDPESRRSGTDWTAGREVLKDPAAQVVGIVYEAVLADTDRDGRLSDDDKKCVLFFRLSDQSVSKLLENVDEILGVEQTSENEAMVFFTEQHRNYALQIHPNSGAPGERVELAAIQTGR